MPYRLEDRVDRAVRRVATEQIDRALRAIDDLEDRHEAVHQVRKRCKKVRGLLRLIRPVCPAYDQENACLRDAARRVSDVRDASSHLETLDDLTEVFDEALGEDVFGAVHAHLEAKRARLAGDALEDELAAIRATLVEVRGRVPAWPIEARGFEAVRGGLVKTWTRAQDAMRTTDDVPTVEAFHEWRKRAKYHWYHLRLLEPLWPDVVEALAEKAHHVANLLGDAHDLAVLLAALAADPPADVSPRTMDALVALAARRRRALERRARPVGERLFGEDADGLAARFGAWWAARDMEQAAAATPAAEAA
ncbi:MAG: CHAD domain-containing protein [Myxococcales bacterium]|nr:CHAD domain-containing protein [Myxococcales bacterium]